MPTDTAEPNKAQILADSFRKMAAAIELNGADNFGGAFVVIPPHDGGDILETLVLDSRQDPAMLWMLLKTKCDMELTKLDQVQRQGNAFGRR
ncbi:MAG: hypothetical protein WC829_01180 [Hyphomicrobium sp.]|jgi:hypothetical protein